jgi:hypothetical protein
LAWNYIPGELILTPVKDWKAFYRGGWNCPLFKTKAALLKKLPCTHLPKGGDGFGAELDDFGGPLRRKHTHAANPDAQGTEFGEPPKYAIPSLCFILRETMALDHRKSSSIEVRYL